MALPGRSIGFCWKTWIAHSNIKIGMAASKSRQAAQQQRGGNASVAWKS